MGQTGGYMCTFYRVIQIPRTPTYLPLVGGLLSVAFALHTGQHYNVMSWVSSSRVPQLRVVIRSRAAAAAIASEVPLK
jgi:hypothetical protein